MWTGRFILALQVLCTLSTHLRFGAIDWLVVEADRKHRPTRVHIHLHQAIRGSLGPYFNKNRAIDPEKLICRTKQNCWTYTLFNGNFDFEVVGSAVRARTTDRRTFHYDGSTPKDLSATTTRFYSDGQRIDAGYQNWIMTERFYIHTYKQATTYTTRYRTCCRQSRGVRNVRTAQFFHLQAKVNLQKVANGIYQNAHCSAFPIYNLRFGISSTLNLNVLCTSPHDSELHFSWTPESKSGLRENGNRRWGCCKNAGKPFLNSRKGIITWNPQLDGLYALQWTVTDDYGNTNILDIMFNVDKSIAGTPYFVEIRRDIFNGATPTKTTDIFNPPAEKISLGQTMQLSIWAYAPSGFMTTITYVWSFTARSTATNTCTGGTKYCELQFTYTPALGDTSRSLSLDCAAQNAATRLPYVGAPSDPSAELTFSIPITIQDRSYIYISGFVRDFRVSPSTEPIATGMVYSNGATLSTKPAILEPNFLLSDLSLEYKPQWDTLQSPAPNTVSQSQFAYWFADSKYSQRVTVSVTLGYISGPEGKPGSLYEGDFNPFWTINCAGWETSSSCKTDINLNKHWTYEVTTYFTYKTGLNIKFESTDFLWIFIDGKMVLADTRMSEQPRSLNLNLDSLTVLKSSPTQTLSLTDGQSYAMSLFYVHRSADYNPRIKWQIPGGTICDAVSGSKHTFNLKSFSSDNFYDTQAGAGMVGLKGPSLRLTTKDTSSSSAVYYKTVSDTSATLFHVRDGFETTFTYRIDSCRSGCQCPSGTCDKVNGFSFIVQADGPGKRGGSGAGGGYEGIANALVVEFDGIEDTSKADPSYNHIGVHISSKIGQVVSATERTSPSNGYSDTALALTPGSSHTIRITYLPGQFVSGSTTRIGWLYVYVDANLTPVVEYSISSTDFDMFSGNAYIGFTASTTSSYAVPIYIDKWSFKVVEPSATLTVFKNLISQATAGVENTGITIQAQDACGAPVANGGDSGKFSVTMTDGTNSVTVTPTDEGSGMYTMKFTATISAVYTMAVLYEGSPINSGSNVRSINVLPSDTVSPTVSFVTAATTNITVGTNSTLTFHLRDQYGNTITDDKVFGSSPSVTVTVTPNPSSFTFPGYVIKSWDPISKVYTVIVNSKETRDSGFTIRVDVLGVQITGGEGSPQTIQFSAGSLDLTQSRIDSSYPPATTLTAGSIATFGVIPADNVGNVITQDPGYTFATKVSSTVTSDPLCQLCYNCTWTNQKYECTYTRQFVGTYTFIVVVYSSSGTLVGTIPATLFQVTIGPDDDAANSVLIHTTKETNIVGATRVIQVQARDQYGNSRSVPNTAGSFQLSLSPTVTSSVATYQGAGIYSFSYTATSVSTHSTVMVTAQWKRSSDSSVSMISNGTVTDRWINAVVNTIANGTVVSIAVGVATVFELKLADSFGNTVQDDQSGNVAVRVTKPDSSISIATITYDSSTKKHLVSFTSTVSGSHTVMFYIFNVFKTQLVAFAPPGTAAGGKIFTSDPGWTPTRENQTEYVRLESTDAYGNVLGAFDSGASYKLNIVGSGCSQTISPAHSNGIYNFTFKNKCKESSVVWLNMTFGSTVIGKTSFTTLSPLASNGNSFVPSIYNFESLKAGELFPFHITAREDSNALTKRTTDNDGFSFTLTVLNLNFTKTSYSPDVPTATAGYNEIVNVSGLSLSYAGTYLMRIFDGLELKQSQTASNGFSGPGYLIRVSAGTQSRYLQLPSTTFASYVADASGTSLSVANCPGTSCHISTTAGLATSIRVYLRDRFGAPVTDNAISVSVSLSLSSRLVDTLTGTYNSAGYWVVSFLRTTKGTYSYSVTAGSITVGPPSYSLSVSPSPAYANTTRMSFPASAEAGTATSVQLCFHDVYNNTAAIPNFNRLNCSFSSSVKTTIYQPSSTLATSGASGSPNEHCFTMTVTETVSGTYNMYCTLDSIQIFNTRQQIVTNSRTVSSSYSRVSGLKNLTAGKGLSLTLSVKDEYNNAFEFTETEKSTFRTRISGPSTLALIEGDGATYSSGGVWTLTLNACATSSCLNGDTKKVGTYRLEFSIGATNIFSNVQIFTMSIISDVPASSEIEYILAGSNPLQIQAGVTGLGVSFQTFDQYGNTASIPAASGVTIEAKVFIEDPVCETADGLSSSSSSLPYATDVSTTTTYTNSGIYAVSITPSKVGTYYLAVLHGNKIYCEGGAPIRRTLTVIASGFLGNATTVTGYSDIEVNVNGSMSLAFHDKFGNKVFAPTSTSVSIYGLQGFTLTGFTLSNGIWTKILGGVSSFSFDYTTTRTGTYDFNVTVDGTPVLSSGYISDQTNNAPSINVTVARVGAYVLAPFGIVRENKLSYVSLQAQDSFGNNVTDSNFDTSLSFEANLNSAYKVDAVVHQRSAGKVVFRFVFYQGGSFTPKVTLKETRNGVAIRTIANDKAEGALTVLAATCKGQDSTKPFRCLDNTCVADYSQCPDANIVCPISVPVRCYTGGCAATSFECPCPSGQERCSTGACQTTGSCLDTPLVTVPNSAHRTVSPTATNNPTVSPTSSNPSVSPTMNPAANLPPGVTSGPTVVPTGVPSMSPTGVPSVPPGTSPPFAPANSCPYLCENPKVCRASAQDCPSPRVCPLGYLSCPDGLSCARDAASCGNFTRVKECPGKKQLCPDGSCATTIDDCPTLVTCLNPAYVVCPDGSCQSDATQCIETNTCGGSLTKTFLCPDLSCVSNAVDCPSSVVCPKNYVLCEDMACAPSLQSCSGLTITCTDSQVKCPDSSCSSNWLSCPSKTTCPLTAPVLCADGQCVADADICKAPPSCNGFTCPDRTCVTKQSLCPTPITCPVDTPVLCNDRSCVESVSQCQETTYCATNVRCPDGSCRDSIEDCPTYSACPSSLPVRCADRSCKATSDLCPATNLTCPGGYIRCPAGDCALSVEVCPTVVTCTRGYKRCVDGTCRQDGQCEEDTGDSTDYCAQDSTIQGVTKIQCPQTSTGVVCRDSLDECPTNIVCPDYAPIRCMDLSCRATLNDCPSPPSTWDSIKPCTDGSYQAVRASCGTPVSCLPTAPYACWDGTCRIDPNDCPAFPLCDQAGDGDFLCPDGSCVDNTNLLSCRSLVSCLEEDLPIRCPIPTFGDECKPSVNDCQDPYDMSLFSEPEVQVCPGGTRRCRTRGVNKADRSGYCAATCLDSFDCGGLTKCDSGYCATGETCPEDNGCPSEFPERCWDGSCRQAGDTTCNIDEGSATDLETCFTGYLGDAASIACDSGGICSLGRTTDFNRRLCPSGSCLAVLSTVGGSTDYSNCPGVSASSNGNVNGCGESETLCLDGTCAKSVDECTKESGGINYCPANRPYRCEGGLCTLGKKFCQSTPLYSATSCPASAKSGKALLRCYSGDCVESYTQCPLIKPCLNGEVRCADGFCVDSAEACTLNNKCPSGFRYRCYTGECASGPQECRDPGQSTGCPKSMPFRCENGACVRSSSSCNQTSSVTGTGCSNGNIKCWNGECKENVDQCPQLNNCPALLPYRCLNGTCVSSTSMCGTDTCTGFLCTDGSCAQSQSLCPTSFGCPYNQPIRCGIGSCAAYPSSSAVILGETAVSSVDTCSSYVFCDSEVACADGSCAQTFDLCPAVVSCPNTTPYKCKDGVTCVSDITQCSLGFRCPPANPLLCSAGGCVDTASDCPAVNELCTDELKPRQCANGDCVHYYADCLPSFSTTSRPGLVENEVKLQGISVSGCGANEYLCSNGLCVPISQKDMICPIIPRCSEATPYRCHDGRCYVSADSCPAQNCPDNTVACTDGTCRDSGECPRYDGCDVGEYICWEEQSCAKDLKYCVNNTKSYLLNPTDKPLIGEIGVCTDDCYRDLRSEFVTASVYSAATTVILVVDDSRLGQALTVTVPAGAVSISDGNPGYIFAVTASESQIRTAENFVRREFFNRLGEIIQYSRTVLSTPFYCWKSANIASFSLNFTVEAIIDRTYRHPARDICLASLSSTGGWRCVFPSIKDREANPVTITDNRVSGSFGECAKVGSTGKLYAFIYTPGAEESLENNNVFGVLQRYWPIIAVSCALIATLLLFIVYYFQRKLRYRKKYRQEKKKQKDKKIELERMKEVGAAGGNVGGGEHADMERNPLQITIDNVNNLQSMLPSDDARKKRYAEEEKTKKQRENYINTLEEENQKLLSLVDNLKSELEQEIA